MDLKEAEKLRLKSMCTKCGKPLSERKSGSLSSWVFRDNYCSCSDFGTLQQRLVEEVVQEDVQQFDELSLPERYEVQALRGRGGMGVVYRVRDKEINKTLAIKVLHPDSTTDATAIKRIQQEIATTASLDHPNIVAVYDHGIAGDGSPYVVLDYVDGPSLSEILDAEVFLDVARAIDLFIQIAEGMGHAHSRDVIHRDLKPSNILTSKTDGTEVAKVVDFGIAKSVSMEGMHTISQTDDAFGTPLYMSPEQCRGEAVDNRSDIYSFGCCMYEALTSKPPFLSENPIKTILKHLYERPASFTKSFKQLDIPIGLERIVMHCLEKDVLDRYQYTEEIVKDLELVRDGRDPVVAKERKVGRGEEGKRADASAATALTSAMLVFYCTGLYQVGWQQFVLAIVFLWTAIQMFVHSDMKLHSQRQWMVAITAAVIGYIVFLCNYFDAFTAFGVFAQSFVTLPCLVTGIYALTVIVSRLKRVQEVERIVGATGRSAWLLLFLYSGLLSSISITVLAANELICINRLQLFPFQSLWISVNQAPAGLVYYCYAIAGVNLLTGLIWFVKSMQPTTKS